VKLPRRRPQRNGATATAEAGPPGDAPRPAPPPELAAQRERLTERFALMQSELGGLFYEMAIRDHVRMEVLIAKAAELQRVDAELSQVDHLLRGDGGTAIGGHCPQCATPHARGAAFCSQCATPLGGS
jgi:hypothetical protein